MNAMQMLSSEAWVERLGWTLVHFLWQGLAIALLYAAARRVMARRSSPNGRYLLACAALAAMMAAPLTTWELMRPPDASPGAAYQIRGVPPAPSTTSVAGAATLPDSVRATVPERTAGTVPRVGRDGLARRRRCVLGAAGGRLGGCRAHAVDAGAACAAGMAGDSKKAWSTDWSVSSRAVARLRAGAGADGGRLAATGGAGAGGGARRSACRACGGPAAA